MSSDGGPARDPEGLGARWDQRSWHPEPAPHFPAEILSGVIRSVKKDGEWKVGVRQNALSKPMWGTLNVGLPPTP